MDSYDSGIKSACKDKWGETMEPKGELRNTFFLYWLILTDAVKSLPHCPCCCSPTPGTCRRHLLPPTRLSGQCSIRPRKAEAYGCHGGAVDFSCKSGWADIKKNVSKCLRASWEIKRQPECWAVKLVQLVLDANSVPLGFSGLWVQSHPVGSHFTDRGTKHQNKKINLHFNIILPLKMDVSFLLWKKNTLSPPLSILNA